MAKKKRRAKRPTKARKRRATGSASGVGTATGVGASIAEATGNAAGKGTATGVFQPGVFQPGVFQGLPPSASSQRKLSPAVQSTRGVIEPPPAAVARGEAHLGGVGSLTVDAIVIPAPIQVIVGRLSKQPVDIRDDARSFAHALKQEAENLRSKRPNDRSERELAKYDDLVSFLEKIAAGLTNLAASLDEAIKEITKGSAEPARLTAAAQIAHNLQQAVMQWLENNAGNRIGTVLDVALFTGSVLFLHSLGADSVAAIGALGLIVRGIGRRKDPPKKKEAKKKRR